MIEIQFPDQSVRAFKKGVTPLEIAQSISEGLARNVLSVKVNGNLLEARTPITEDGIINLFTWNDKEGKAAFWHSSAHILAQSLISLYPQAKLTIGPAIENGFYYDVDFGEASFSEKDLPALEKQFMTFAREKFEFKMRMSTKSDALKFYKNEKKPL